MTVHFSVLGEKGICGTGPSKRGVFEFTGDPAVVTCERCKEMVKKENATGAHVWALEAAATRERRLKNANGALPTKEHVQQLYALAVQKRQQAVEFAREKLEYEQEQLQQTLAHASTWGPQKEGT